MLSASKPEPSGSDLTSLNEFRLAAAIGKGRTVARPSRRYEAGGGVTPRCLSAFSEESAEA